MSKQISVEASESKALDSEHHTLFIEDIKESRSPVKGKPGQYKITQAHKLYRVYISVFSESKKGLHVVFNELRNAERNDKLELRINSHGGLVAEGKQFYNVIAEKFPGNTTTYLDNYGYSMGALLFCMGRKRIAYPYSALMFHNYSHGSWGKGGNVKSHVKHTSRTLNTFFRDLTVETGFLSEKEFKQMLLGKDFWMDSKEMCERGIATHVIVEGERLTAKKYLKLLKKDKKQRGKLAKNEDLKAKSKKGKKSRKSGKK